MGLWGYGAMDHPLKSPLISGLEGYRVTGSQLILLAT